QHVFAVGRIAATGKAAEVAAQVAEEPLGQVGGAQAMAPRRRPAQERHRAYGSGKPGPYFCNSSYGYRPGRSPDKAIQDVRSCIRRGAHWVLKTDISHFFDSIDRSILMEQHQDTIADEYLCDLILQVISPCVWCLDGERRFQEPGVPQGNAVSPFLSNLHLHQFDLACLCPSRETTRAMIELSASACANKGDNLLVS
ncbi:MAG: group II intron reverse transcriptase domain-containing protein, partial [Acidobacteria bacterium]|nr:group II intron reverse transcriptase domain-containing protein [Acidobacteriota bacterium]